MATTFVYRVRDRAGKVASGQLESDSPAAVATKLRQMGYIVLEVKEQARAQSLGQIEIFKQKVKIKDIAVFCRQFATMINSGLALTRALAILSEQTENKTLANIISQVQADVEAGQTLSEALAKHKKVFSELFISMVKAGETGGVLDIVLLRIAEHFEKEMALKMKIKSAMTYPVLMFIMSIVMVVVMMTFIVPVFVNMFTSLGGELPLPTRMLIAASNFMRGFWYLIIGAALGARYGFRAYKRTPQGKLLFDQIKLRLPVFGSLTTKLAIGRFSRTFSTLVASGVPILQSLDIVADTANNEVISRAVMATRSSIKEGETIAEPLSKAPVFPPMVVQMIAIGEETGALDKMLAKIADFYEQEAGALVESITSLIEPLMIVFLGAIIGGIIISLYMPMFNLINLIK